jgi:hypothetical protein
VPDTDEQRDWVIAFGSAVARTERPRLR